MVLHVSRTTAATHKMFNNTAVYQTSDSDESCVATVVRDPPDKSIDCENLDQSSVQGQSSVQDITIGRFQTNTFGLVSTVKQCSR